LTPFWTPHCPNDVRKRSFQINKEFLLPASLTLSAITLTKFARNLGLTALWRWAAGFVALVGPVLLSSDPADPIYPTAPPCLQVIFLARLKRTYGGLFNPLPHQPWPSFSLSCQTRFVSRYIKGRHDVVKHPSCSGIDGLVRLGVRGESKFKVFDKYFKCTGRNAYGIGGRGMSDSTSQLLRTMSDTDNFWLLGRSQLFSARTIRSSWRYNWYAYNSMSNDEGALEGSWNCDWLIAEYRFYPQNHSVARAAFGPNPCIPYELTGPGRVGFWSGFEPIALVLSNVRISSCPLILEPGSDEYVATNLSSSNQRFRASILLLLRSRRLSTGYGRSS